MDFMEPLQAIDYGAIAVTLLFFAVGSVLDLRTREVPDKVWLVYGLLAGFLTAARLLTEPSLLILTLASIGVTCLVSFGLLYFGLFGGADAKAIICLGLALPLIPSSPQPLIGYLHPFFPFVVVIVGFVCSASVALWLGLRNFVAYLKRGREMFAGLEQESAWRKAMAGLTGYPADVSKLRSTIYLYPIEKVVDGADGAQRRFNLFFSAETDRAQMVSEFIESLGKVGSPSNIWVSPGLPMLLFIFVGLVITLVFGDLIFSAFFLLAAR
jgi:preflagellin peptidase FlaK